MSAPTPDQQDAALAALTGTVSEAKPETELDRSLMRLRLVMEAQRRGASWTMIGAAMNEGLSG